MMQEVVAGLAVHLSGMSYRERLRLLLADRVAHEPHRFALLTSTRAASKYGLLGTLKNLLVGADAAWGDVRAMSSSLSLGRRRQERVLRTAFAPRELHSEDERAIGDLAMDEIAPATAAAARRAVAEAAAKDTGSGSLLRFAFRDPPAAALTLAVPRAAAGAGGAASARLRAAAGDSPVLAALLAKHGGLGGVSGAQAAGAVDGIAPPDRVAAAAAAAELPRQAVALPSRVDLAASEARAVARHGRRMPVHSASSAPLVVAVPRPPVLPGARLPPGAADGQRAVSAAISGGPGSGLALRTAEGSGLLALLEVVAWDTSAADAALGDAESDPLVARVAREAVRGAEDALRSLGRSVLESLPDPAAPRQDPAGTAAPGRMPGALHRAASRAVDASRAPSAGGQEGKAVSFDGDDSAVGSAGAAAAGRKFDRRRLVEHARVATEAKAQRQRESEHAGAWRRVRAVLSRLPVAIGVAYRGREARAALAYERRAQWLQYEHARSVVEVRARAQARAAEAEAEVWRLREQLEESRLEARRVRQAAARAGVPLPPPPRHLLVSADNARGGAAAGDDRGPRLSTALGAFGGFEGTAGAARTPRASPRGRGGAFGVPAASPRAGGAAAWMDSVGRTEEVGTQTTAEWGADDGGAAGPGAGSRAARNSVARVTGPGYDADVVVQDIATGRGDVAEFARVLAEEWASGRERAADASSLTALRAAQEREGAASSIKTLANELRTRIASPPWFRLLDLSERRIKAAEAESAAVPEAADVGALAARLAALRREMIATAVAAEQDRREASGAERPKARFAVVARQILQRKDDARSLRLFVKAGRKKAIAAAKREIATRRR